MKEICSTRWTNLGESLERLLTMWPVLKLNMDYIKENRKSEDVKKIIRFYFLLNNNVFKLKIRFIEVVINQHKKLQNK